MAHSRMVSRGVDFSHRVPCFLDEHALKFDKLGGYANIHPAPASGVHGVLYDVTEAGLAQLDRFEGRPEHYDRQPVRVLPTTPGLGICGRSGAGDLSSAGAPGDGDAPAVQTIAYIAQPDMVRPDLVPRADYVLHLLGGADLLPERHVEELRASPGPGKGSRRSGRLEAKYFFVYGTLRPDGDGAWTARFNAGVTGFRANLSGATLYDDSIGYAAVVLDSPDQAERAAGRGTVHGYLLTADDATLARKLKEADRIEGYPSLYKRAVRQVAFSATGKTVKAYVYHRPDADTARPVASGDYYDRAARGGAEL